MKEALTIPEAMANDRKNNIAKVINDYSKRLMGFIRKRVNNDADAEDVLQDVFYQFAGNTQPIEQLTAWLFTVARNKITDRKRKHKPEAIEEIFAPTNDGDAFNWTELLFESGENPENAALDELPAEQREVFVKQELEGISFKELSEQSGETINTLISRKRYAVLHLRNRLAVLKDELLNY